MRVYQFHHSRSLRARRISRPPGASSPGGIGFGRDGPRGAQAAGVPAGVPRPGRVGARRPDGGGGAGVRRAGAGWIGVRGRVRAGEPDASARVVAAGRRGGGGPGVPAGGDGDRRTRAAREAGGDRDTADRRVGAGGGGGQVWMPAGLSGVSGAASGFFNPASTGLLPALVAPEDLQQANGLRATVMAGGEIGGAGGGGGIWGTSR